MNIDERLEALTMNLELTARDVNDLRLATAEMQQRTEAFQQRTEAFQQRTEAFQQRTEAFQRATSDRFAQWELEKKHLDDKVDSLADSTRMLLAAVQGQQTRIERLERKVQ